LVFATPAHADETNDVVATDGSGQAAQATVGICNNKWNMVKTNYPGQTGFFGYGNTNCPAGITVSAVTKVHRLFTTVAQGNWCLAASVCSSTVVANLNPFQAPATYWMSYTVQEIAGPGLYFPGPGNQFCTGYGTNHLSCNFATPGQSFP
jgi:hypothetical protein